MTALLGRGGVLSNKEMKERGGGEGIYSRRGRGWRNSEQRVFHEARSGTNTEYPQRTRESFAKGEGKKNHTGRRLPLGVR